MNFQKVMEALSRNETCEIIQAPLDWLKLRILATYLLDLLTGGYGSRSALHIACWEGSLPAVQVGRMVLNLMLFVVCPSRFLRVVF